MNSLSASSMLRVWERALGRTSPERALALLAAACPEMSAEELSALSVGRRDRLLIALRERTFGPRLTSLATCDACGESLELSFDCSDISADEEALTPGELSIERQGYEARFRLPNSGDLIAVAHSGDADSARRSLLERCLTTASHEGSRVSLKELPAALVEAVE